MRGSRRFSWLRIAIMLALLGATVLVMAPVAIADHNPNDCQPGDEINISTNDLPHPGGIPVLGAPLNGRSTCGDLHRTLVFVGSAQVTNGVNFAGVGGTQICAALDSGTGQPWKLKDGTTNAFPTSDGLGANCPYTTISEETGDTVPFSSGVASGSYVFDGDCVAIDYDSQTLAIVSVTGCGFDTTDGFYGPPTEADLDFFNYDVPEDLSANGLGPVADAWSTVFDTLGWGPGNQASCFNSNGTGYSTFTFTKAGIGEQDGVTEQWRAHYSWQNSLSNLRGENRQLVNGVPTGPTYDFDAKIRVDADHVLEAHPSSPKDPNPVERTDAACLLKTVNPLINQPINDTTGINTFQVVGNATWRIQFGADL